MLEVSRIDYRSGLGFVLNENFSTFVRRKRRAYSKTSEKVDPPLHACSSLLHNQRTEIVQSNEIERTIVGSKTGRWKGSHRRNARLSSTKFAVPTFTAASPHHCWRTRNFEMLTDLVDHGFRVSMLLPVVQIYHKFGHFTPSRKNHWITHIEYRTPSSSSVDSN